MTQEIPNSIVVGQSNRFNRFWMTNQLTSKTMYRYKTTEDAADDPTSSVPPRAQRSTRDVATAARTYAAMCTI
jgi:hypothetical protein